MGTKHVAEIRGNYLRRASLSFLPPRIHNIYVFDCLEGVFQDLTAAMRLVDLYRTRQRGVKCKLDDEVPGAISEGSDTAGAPVTPQSTLAG